MKELSLAKQEYLHAPLWSRNLSVGRIVISMSVKQREIDRHSMRPYSCNRLEDLRREQGLTRRDLAYSLRISEATLKAMEQGRYMPSLELALRVSAWFALPVEAIFSVRENRH